VGFPAPWRANDRRARCRAAGLAAWSTRCDRDGFPALSVSKVITIVLPLLTALLALAAAGVASSPRAASTPASASGAIALAAPDGSVAPGRAVPLEARVADAAGRPVITWDLDADGRFDDAAGPAVRARFDATGAPHRVRVTAMWLDGPVTIVRTAGATIDVAAATR
jgi:hypothetical protein